MRTRTEQSGLTLTEMVVVIAAMTILVAFGLPAVRALLHSFESQSGTKSMINAALATARAVAAKEQHYAGIRFQRDLDGDQYMVLIIHDFEKTGLSPGFRAVEGIKPIKLPENSVVMDLIIVTDRSDSQSYYQVELDKLSSGEDTWINEAFELIDTTTFSVLFSPTGKLVIHRVQVRNENGIPDTERERTRSSNDDVFNKKGDVDKPTQELIDMGMGREIAMFYQDDYYGVLDTPAYSDVPPHPDLGLGPEKSRVSFVICDRDKFRQAYDNGQAWSNYLAQIASDRIYINPYMGTMINNP